MCRVTAKALKINKLSFGFVVKLATNVHMLTQTEFFVLGHSLWTFWFEVLYLNYIFESFYHEESKSFVFEELQWKKTLKFLVYF